ncbi:MAG: DUF4301 family protein [Bacteroidales bacterium]|nr:DUF4301 family protein [Bacteroidales bacterium]
MKQTFSAADIEQMSALGITPEMAESQIERFRTGFPRTQLVAAATVDNGGIVRLSEDRVNHLCNVYQRRGKHLKTIKFVPASGAATRMFKELYEFSAKYYGVASNFAKEYPTVKQFLDNLQTFAFYDDLKACMERSGLDINEYMSRGDYSTIINYLLKEQFLGYGVLPKGLLKFHRYGAERRTPVEEHIVEGAEYARSADGKIHLHFTVSPEHRRLFRALVAKVRHRYEKEFGVKLNITFSEQKHYTDTIAVDEQNNPLRDEDGHLVFRPGGHGALIENLNEQHADIIFIKNIDNVVPDWLKQTTIIYKKALAGMLIELRNKSFRYLRVLDGKVSPQMLKAVENFARKELNISLPDKFTTLSQTERAKTLRNALNRPIRICGMVKNQGEPGGGPFFTLNSHGIKSLQIVETAQINRNNPEQEAILQGSTHFNPVDLVCSTKNYRGQYFDLRQHVDPETGFISKKSRGAQTLKSQELPGLWNGAMADWITLFVEVPLITFNPVKTVNDLLRKEHLED